MRSLNIPRIFVKRSVSDGENIRNFLIIKDDYVEVASGRNNIAHLFDEIYVEEVYDDSYKYFLDFENNKLCMDVCVIVGNSALFLDTNAKISLREFVGKNIVPLVSVGEIVNKSSRLVAIFTGKRELRYGLSTCSGIVFYFTQVEYKPQKYLFVISEDVKVRKVA